MEVIVRYRLTSDDAIVLKHVIPIGGKCFLNCSNQVLCVGKYRGQFLPSQIKQRWRVAVGNDQQRSTSILTGIYK